MLYVVEYAIQFEVGVYVEVPPQKRSRDLEEVVADAGERSES